MYDGPNRLKSGKGWTKHWFSAEAGGGRANEVQDISKRIRKLKEWKADNTSEVRRATALKAVLKLGCSDYGSPQGGNFQIFLNHEASKLFNSFPSHHCHWCFRRMLIWLMIASHLFLKAFFVPSNKGKHWQYVCWVLLVAHPHFFPSKRADCPNTYTFVDEEFSQREKYANNFLSC